MSVNSAEQIQSADSVSESTQGTASASEAGESKDMSENLLETHRQMDVEDPEQLRDFCDPTVLLHRVVSLAVKRGGSDIHLRVGAHPAVRLSGRLHRIKDSPRLRTEDMENLARSLMQPKHWEQFQENYQVDLSIGVKGVGRVRLNAYYQRGTIAMALRIINSTVPTPEDLGLPDHVLPLTDIERGLVLLTGATGSGKSTTIASLINRINQKYAKHIITIEDPIEYLFKDEQCIISQRELGADALSFGMAMKAALREDPDVILLGEMRDQETIETALTAAETGHLVFSTVHSPNAVDTVARVVSNFQPQMQQTIRAKFAQNLAAVVSQRLVPTANGEGRTVACEVMTVSPRIRELMLDPLEVSEIKDLVNSHSTVEGMLSFDQHLLQLVQKKIITPETALQHSSSPTDMRLLLDGFG